MKFKSNVCHVFSNINGSLISFNFLPRLRANVNRRQCVAYHTKNER